MRSTMAYWSIRVGSDIVATIGILNTFRRRSGTYVQKARCSYCYYLGYFYYVNSRHTETVWL